MHSSYNHNEQIVTIRPNTIQSLQEPKKKAGNNNKDKPNIDIPHILI